MKGWDEIPLTLTKLFADAALGKAVGAFLCGVLAYVFPTQALLSTAGSALGLVVLDAASGLLRAWKTETPITSARFSRTIVKILGYTIACTAFGLGFRAVPGLETLQTAAISTVLGTVIVTEMISIAENLAGMGIRIPGWILTALRAKEQDLDQKPAVEGE